MQPGPPCPASALSAAGMLLCVTEINARGERTDPGVEAGSSAKAIYLLREVRGHRQRNAVLIF